MACISTVSRFIGKKAPKLCDNIEASIVNKVQGFEGQQNKMILQQEGITLGYYPGCRQLRDPTRRMRCSSHMGCGYCVGNGDIPDQTTNGGGDNLLESYANFSDPQMNPPECIQWTFQLSAGCCCLDTKEDRRHHKKAIHKHDEFAFEGSQG